MRFTKLLPFITVALLVTSCFLPWMTIESKGITITGINTAGTSFGEPALFHFVWAGLYLLFLLIPRVWAKRSAVGFAAFNIAWAIRNFLLLPSCQMGDCPVKRVGLYLVLLSSVLLFCTVFFISNEKDTTPVV